jgi:hypothetical protein
MKMMKNLILILNLIEFGLFLQIDEHLTKDEASKCCSSHLNIFVILSQ